MRYPIGTRIYFYDPDDKCVGWGEIQEIDTNREEPYHLVFDDESSGWYNDGHMIILESAVDPKYTVVKPHTFEEDLFTI